MKFLVVLLLLVVGFFVWNSAVSTDPEAAGSESPTDTRPSWIDDPASFYGEPRDDLYFAVGKATVAGNLSSGLQMAEMKARAGIAKQQTGSKIENMGNETKTSVEAASVGSQRVAQWLSPEDEIYVLMIQPK